MKAITKTLAYAFAILFFSAMMIQTVGALEIGVVDMQNILAKYNKVKKINDDLQKEKDKKQNQLDKKQNELKNMKEQLDKKFPNLSEKDKQREAEKLEKKLRELQNFHEDLMGELRNKQAGKYKDLEKDIIEAVRNVAKDKKVDIVLEKGVVFTGGRDLTDAVINKLNR
jgi:outer membrane protein